MSFANLTSASSYWKRDVYQSTDSTEALQNIFNYTTFVPNLYSDNDTTWQIAQELRLTSRGEGDFQWVGGLYYSNLHSGYVTKNQAVGFVTTPVCSLPGLGGDPSLGGHCAPGSTYLYAPPLTGPNPEGIMFNDNNPNILSQKAIFGEASYKLTPTLKLTTGCGSTNSTSATTPTSAASARHREMPHPRSTAHPEAIPVCCRR